jgi:hypothetical protein
MIPLSTMRFLLVASNKSSQIPIEVPDEIVNKKVVKSVKKRTKAVKRNNKKPKDTKRKRSQIARAIAR